MQTEDKIVYLVGGEIVIPRISKPEPDSLLFGSSGKINITNIENLNHSFPKVRLPKGGVKIRFEIFGLKVRNRASSNAILKFFRSKKNSVYVGFQGLILVCQQHPDLMQITKKSWFIPICAKRKLWRNQCGSYRVPVAYQSRKDKFEISLTSFENDWNSNFAFVRFYREV